MNATSTGIPAWSWAMVLNRPSPLVLKGMSAIAVTRAAWGCSVPREGKKAGGDEGEGDAARKRGRPR
jgi:hypothetical protein